MEEIFKLKKYLIDQSLPMSSLYDKVLLRESGLRIVLSDLKILVIVGPGDIIKRKDVHGS